MPLPPNGRRARIPLRPGYTGGTQYLEWHLMGGYLMLIEGPPHGQTIYIPRDQLIQLIKWLAPLLKEMDTNHDPVLAMRAQSELDLIAKRERRERMRSPRRRRRLRRRSNG